MHLLVALQYLTLHLHVICVGGYVRISFVCVPVFSEPLKGLTLDVLIRLCWLEPIAALL